jgi:diguanylate cyclase (GGDEF)-like protein
MRHPLAGPVAREPAAMPTPSSLIWLLASALVVLAVVCWRLAQVNRRLRAELRRRRKTEAALHERSATDVVTGVLNRAGFMDKLGRGCLRATRHGHPLAVVMLDFDHFKGINDTYGHAFGDRTLVAVARACQSVVRDPDFLGRLGGDEFAVGMPHTDIDGARHAAERIRAAVSAVALALPGGRSLSVTASVGLAVLQNSDTLQSLLARGDRAVYEAKRLGRNRVAAS